MSFAAAIQRTPLPHDTEAGAAAAQDWADQPPEMRAVLAGAAGSSLHLRHLMGVERDWLRAALTGSPKEMEGLVTMAPRADTAKALGPALRQAKRRLALYAGLADLAGVWPLETLTGALARFADSSVQVALEALLRPALARGALPGQTEADLEACAGMVALAMGKMGAHELNYSSDIDLICLFDDDRYPGADAGTARTAFVRVMRQVTSLLQDMTAEGYVWRVDLRLRPDPSVTPIVQSMSAAERYYESFGRTWERAAHIKARPAAGDIVAGARYLERLRPFVWRKHLDFAAVQDAHDIRLRIKDHKGLHQTELAGRDLKLGSGGIREIEFFTQTRQLIAGGRDASLRLRGTVPALKALAQSGWVPDLVAAELTDHYRALREVEHRVQMVEDARTHALPTSADGMDRIARLCGEGDTARFCADLSERLRAVAAESDGFFTGGAVGLTKAAPVVEPEIVERWRHYPALRSERARASFARMKPDLLARLSEAAAPDQAFAAFDGFLAGLPAGVQLFALFEANPKLRALITDIAATAPALAQYLAGHARVFDAVVGGDFFAPWPGVEALTQGLAAALTEAPDHEARLDAARRWQAEWHFRIGVHLLRGLIDVDTAGRHYAQLAEACLAALFPVAVAHVSARHGPPPGQGATVLGMGALGAGWLNARSDLDVILIYDAPGEAQSEGPRPLAARAYYAKLTQALVTAVAAATAEGRLYEVDMRLRPSGRSGPVATSLAAFAQYQRSEAWTWEHLALTRARAVAGVAEVGRAAEAVRRDVLALPRDADKVRTDVDEMRGRLAQAKVGQGPFDVKAGPGGLREIELMVQAAALLAGTDARETPAQAARAGVLGLDATEVADLIDAAALQRKVLGAARLVHAGDLHRGGDLAEGASLVLCRETGHDDIATLEAALVAARARADRLVTQGLARGPA